VAKSYQNGATWEARGNGKLYKIEYDLTQSPFCFCISITGLNGKYLGMRDHCYHYARYGTIRGATRFCRNVYCEKLTFKRIK